MPEDHNVIAAGASFLRTISLAWGFIGVQLALSGALCASGNMVIAMVLTLVSQWVLQFPLAYILSKHTDLGADGVWWSMPVAQIAIALITLAIYAKGDWKKTRLLNEEDRLTESVSEEIIAEESVNVRSSWSLARSKRLIATGGRAHRVWRR